MSIEATVRKLLREEKEKETKAEGIKAKIEELEVKKDELDESDDKDVDEEKEKIDDEIDKLKEELKTVKEGKMPTSTADKLDDKGNPLAKESQLGPEADANQVSGGDTDKNGLAAAAKAKETNKKPSTKPSDASPDAVGDDGQLGTEKMPTKSMPKVSVKVESIDSDEIMAALLNGENLTEEFQTKTKTIFEAAVVERCNSALKEAIEDLHEQNEQYLREQIELVENKLDVYLDYVVENWMKENQLAVHQGIREERYQRIYEGVKKVMKDNNVDIDEEKKDALEEAEKKIEELKGKISEYQDKAAKESKEVKEAAKKKEVDDVAEGLTLTQKEKLETLAEGIEFNGTEDFRKRLEIIKESFFGENTTCLTEGNLHEEHSKPTETTKTTKEIDPAVRPYVQALSRKPIL